MVPVSCFRTAVTSSRFRTTGRRSGVRAPERARSLQSQPRAPCGTGTRSHSTPDSASTHSRAAAPRARSETPDSDAQRRAWMHFSVKDDVAPDPVDVRLLGPAAVMTCVRSRLRAHTIQKLVAGQPNSRQRHANLVSGGRSLHNDTVEGNGDRPGRRRGGLDSAPGTRWLSAHPDPASRGNALQWLGTSVPKSGRCPERARQQRHRRAPQGEVRKGRPTTAAT